MITVASAIVAASKILTAVTPIILSVAVDLVSSRASVNAINEATTNAQAVHLSNMAQLNDAARTNAEILNRVAEEEKIIKNHITSLRREENNKDRPYDFAGKPYGG